MHATSSVCGPQVRGCGRMRSFRNQESFFGRHNTEISTQNTNKFNKFTTAELASRGERHTGCECVRMYHHTYMAQHESAANRQKHYPPQCDLRMSRKICMYRAHIYSTSTRTCVSCLTMFSFTSSVCGFRPYHLGKIRVYTRFLSLTRSRQKNTGTPRALIPRIMRLYRRKHKQTSEKVDTIRGRHQRDMNRRDK